MFLADSYFFNKVSYNKNYIYKELLLGYIVLHKNNTLYFVLGRLMIFLLGGLAHFLKVLKNPFKKKKWFAYLLTQSYRNLKIKFDTYVLFANPFLFTIVDFLSFYISQ